MTPRDTAATGPGDVVIVGGGIWGLSIAYHLAVSKRAGRIVVLERNADLAAETTKQAAGQIGQLRSHPIMVRGVKYTLDLLTEFKTHTGHDPGLCTPGSLHLALRPERLRAFERHLTTAKAQGISVEVASASLIRKLAPSIDVSRIEGAIYVHGDGYVDARQTALAYAAAARDLGVDIRLGVRVTGLVCAQDGAASGVATDGGTIEAGQVVIAAGPWTALLTEGCGFIAPVEGIRLQQARTVIDPAMPAEHPVVRIPDHSCYLRPERGGYLFGYFDPEPEVLDPLDQLGDFTTGDIAPQTHLIDDARCKLEPIFPVLGRLPIEEYRQGVVTCAPDGWYVLGPMPGRSRLWLATGCEAMGIAGSGAVGKWLAQWIVEGQPDEDLSLMAPGRWNDRVSDRGWLREACRRTYMNYYSLSGGATYSVGGE